MQEPKEPIPLLVKPDGTRQPVGSTITRDELLDAIKLVIGHQQSAEDIATKVAREVAMSAVMGVREQLDKPEDRKGDWNIKNFPDRSVFNPGGENARVGGTPRPAIVGDIWWNGQFLRANDHTVDECVLINQLRPGLFHGGQWLVKDLAPGVPGARKLLVLFPCKDPDQRSNLPSMVDMLRELTAQTATPALATA